MAADAVRALHYVGDRGGHKVACFLTEGVISEHTLAERPESAVNLRYQPAWVVCQSFRGIGIRLLVRRIGHKRVLRTCDEVTRFLHPAHLVGGHPAKSLLGISFTNRLTSVFDDAHFADARPVR